MRKANSYIADELENKVKFLNMALDQANLIIKTLEEENHRIKDVITNLASINKEDLGSVSEVNDDRLCAV